jgi:hypothetical protein
MRFRVSRATGSQNSIEAPSHRIASARCSLASRSVQAIPSIAQLRLIRCAMIDPARLKID